MNFKSRCPFIGPTICSLFLALIATLGSATAVSGKPFQNAQNQDNSPIGDAWRDPQNPVTQLWDGQRLDHWSWKRPIRPKIPLVGEANWAKTPIDPFILCQLQKLGLAPSGEADRRTLIRRATLDLIGLPPTTQDVREFLDDKSDDAYEKLVDRLLASPQYGVRWGRHWLDVVRYADTNGFERDEFKTTIWRYRDYVIRSFNEDLPYDEFIREQIAGDTMTSADSTDPRRELRLTAVGYLRLGPWDTTKSKFDTEDAGRDELMVDLTNTTGSAFLAQTLACCRCHDHKTDPLLHADHYRLRAFFAGVEFDDEVVIDPNEVQSNIARHNASIDARLEPLEKRYRETLQPGRERLTAKTIRTFPSDIQKLLEIPESKRDAATAQVLEPYIGKLDFYEDDIAQELTDSEKRAFEEARLKVQELEKEKLEFTTVYGVKEKESSVPATHVLEGGAFTDPKEEVFPGFFSALDPNPFRFGPTPVGTKSGRRRALADWIASRENPWTARVMVNRLWHHHFGRGIVTTPDDFGYSGTAPSHPELLDWLAMELVESGWSIKHLHRMILLSSTYRQSSQEVPQNQITDPTNRYLSRQNMRRLDAETLRDSILSVSGMLEQTVGGPPLWPEVPEAVLRAQPGIYENSGRLQGYYTSKEQTINVRSAMLVRKRSVPLPFLLVFNQSDASGTCGRREVTNNAPQALSLLNNPISILASASFASRLSSTYSSSLQASLSVQIGEAFWNALGRDATSEEIAVIIQSAETLRQSLARSKTKENESSTQSLHHENSSLDHLVLAELCRAILNSNEFIFIE